jgi:hypothetical protein
MEDKLGWPYISCRNTEHFKENNGNHENLYILNDFSVEIQFYY